MLNIQYVFVQKWLNHVLWVSTINFFLIAKFSFSEIFYGSSLSFIVQLHLKNSKVEVVSIY